MLSLSRTIPELKMWFSVISTRRRLSAKCSKFGIEDRCSSLDVFCDSDVDAIAIITQHHLHGPQAVQVLRAGKHVYSASALGDHSGINRRTGSRLRGKAKGLHDWRDQLLLPLRNLYPATYGQWRLRPYRICRSRVLPRLYPQDV